MNKKLISGLYLLAALTFFLPACGSAIPTFTSTPLPTFTSVVKTPTVLPYTPLPFPTIDPLAQPTNVQSTGTSTPLPISLPKFPLDKYVLLFVKDGDLYFQDGDNSPIKVTHVGEEQYNYMFSDDNQKVVLFIPFSYAFGSVGYSIKIDGTQAKSILPSGWPERNLLWGTLLGNVEFLPGSHQLIFSTHSCSSYDKYDNPSSCVSSIFLMNTGTSEVKKLADLGFTGVPKNNTFKISPNGKMVAISTTTHVEIIDMEGNAIRHNILPFKPNTPSILFPAIFWLPDSSGLIVALPNALFEGEDSMAFNYVPAYTIWKYKIDSNGADQIQLDPPPMAFDGIFSRIDVSPDGKWIVYGGFGGGTEVYVGNLENENVEIFGKSVQASFLWSSDSRSFIVSSGGSVIGTINVPSLRYANNCGGWIDSNHLACPITQEGVNKLGVAEIVLGGLNYFDLGFDDDVRIVLIKPK